VDLKAAETAGVPVFHGPFSSTRSVAELAIGFVFALFRKVGEKNLGAHQGKWLKKVDGAEIRGKTIGIIGFSNIGSQVGLMAEALGMNVIYYDVANVLPLGNAQRKENLDDLYKEADVISVHVPSLPTTRGMINKEAISKMKDGAMVINTSRGDIFNDQDICEALESGKLGGIATDVYTTEPKSPQEPLESPFIKYPNALLTPHIGGSTKEAQSGIGAEVAGKVLDFLHTGKTADAINFPKLNLPPHQGTHRVLHIHENVPGMLAKLNDTFGRKDINIAAQFLETSNNIGYVVTDIDCECSKEIFEEVRSIPHTIKSYVLS
jgi:D-3-phosphoglycerate dehydrogenase